MEWLVYGSPRCYHRIVDYATQAGIVHRKRARHGLPPTGLGS